MPWKELDHPADIRLEIEAQSVEELFRASAEAFYSVSAGEFPSCFPNRTRGPIQIETSQEGDLSELLVRWMNELLFFLETENIVFLPESIDVDVQKGTLVAQGRWSPATVRGGRVKAVTYGGLELDPGPPWRFRVILDV